MKRAVALLAAISISLGGCVTAGTNFDPAEVAKLQPGDTEQSIIARLGPPNSIARTANGNVVMVWVFTSGNALGQGSSRSVTLLLGPDRKLLKILGESSTQVNIL